MVSTDELTVAVAQPRTVSHDLAHNAREHARAVREAGARLVVFPEMSLTGYELDAAAVAPHDQAIAPIVAACREVGAVALVGAPVREGDAEYIATLRIDGGGVETAYRKVWLHGGETARFAAGTASGVIAVDGWRVGLAICRDTGVSRHTAALVGEGIDVYAAGVLDVPDEREERAARSVVTARALGVPVAVASYAGSTSLYPETAGGSAVLDAEGRVLASAGDTPGSVVTASVGRGRGAGRRAAGR